ncbi:hypothetical protein GCM10020254_07790 [Streptomyces goshikiensis]
MGGPAGRIDLVQLNGDHRADYVKIFPDGSVRAALNTLGADGRIHWVDQGIIAPGVGQPGDSVRFADMNGDGLDDYLVLGAKGSLWSFLNRPGSDGKIHWEAQGRVFPYYHGTKKPGDESGISLGWTREDVRLEDVNGDGLDDYLVVGPAGSMDAHVHVPNSMTWTKIDTFATGTKAGPRARMRLGDVNGDRKADYLVVGRTGAVHAYVNHMTGMSDGNWTEHKYFAKESFYPDTAVAFRDVTGDNRADYLVVRGRPRPGMGEPGRRQPHPLTRGGRTRSAHPCQARFTRSASTSKLRRPGRNSMVTIAPGGTERRIRQPRERAWRSASPVSRPT